MSFQATQPATFISPFLSQFEMWKIWLEYKQPCLIRMWNPWVDFVLAGTVWFLCTEVMGAQTNWSDGNPKTSSFIDKWIWKACWGKLQARFGLILPGCLWLVENNLHERSLLRWISFSLLTLHQPFSEKSFEIFNAKLMHFPATLSSTKSFACWIISLHILSRIAFQVQMGVRCCSSSIIK